MSAMENYAHRYDLDDDELNDLMFFCQKLDAAWTQYNNSKKGKMKDVGKKPKKLGKAS